MPYSTKYSEERHGLAAAYIAKVNDLKEGKVLSFSLPSQEDTAKFIWLLHDYLNLVGCSSLYTIRQITETTLVIGKTKPRLSNVVSLGDTELGRGFSLIVENLLSSTSPREYLASLVRDETISFGTISAVTAEYSRVMES